MVGLSLLDSIALPLALEKDQDHHPPGACHIHPASTLPMEEEKKPMGGVAHTRIDALTPTSSSSLPPLSSPANANGGLYGNRPRHHPQLQQRRSYHHHHHHHHQHQQQQQQQQQQQRQRQSMLLSSTTPSSNSKLLPSIFVTGSSDQTLDFSANLTNLLDSTHNTSQRFPPSQSSSLLNSENSSSTSIRSSPPKPETNGIYHMDIDEAPLQPDCIESPLLSRLCRKPLPAAIESTGSLMRYNSAPSLMLANYSQYDIEFPPAILPSNIHHPSIHHGLSEIQAGNNPSEYRFRYSNKRASSNGIEGDVSRSSLSAILEHLPTLLPDTYGALEVSDPCKHQEVADNSLLQKCNKLIRHSSSPAGILSRLSSPSKSSLIPSSSTESGLIRQTSLPIEYPPQLALENIGETNEKINSSPRNLSDEGNWDISAFRSNYPVRGATSMMNIQDDDAFAARKRDTLEHAPSLTSQFNHLGMASIELNMDSTDMVLCRARAKRGFATHPRSIAERVRRTKISEKMKKLQDLVPSLDKQANTANMLDEAVEYIKVLKRQVEELSASQSKCDGSCRQKERG